MYLTINQLSLSFAQKKVLKQIDLTIGQGELVCLLGPSGCGKSSLLRCIAGLEKPQSGTICLAGEEIQHIATKKRDIGFVFQQYALFPNMTVFDNVAYGLKVKKLAKEQIVEKVSQLLTLVHLGEFANQSVERLSGGQKQRVALARALATEPKILLLDEPLSALDAKIRKQLQKDLLNIQRKLQMTMVFVTHDQEEALLISDRIFVLNDGKIEQVATPDELYRQPASQFVAEFIGSYNRFEHSELLYYMPLTSEHSVYYIRPEKIQLQPIPNSLVISVKLVSVTILGNIRRLLFVDLRQKEIIVDCLNNQSIPNDIQQLYIDPDAFVSLSDGQELIGSE